MTTPGSMFIEVYLKHLHQCDKSELPKKRAKIAGHYPLVSDILNKASFELVLPSNGKVSGLLELPPNVWLRILLLLPFSHIPEITLVCKNIFIMVRQKAQYGLYIKDTYNLGPTASSKHNINNSDDRCLPQLMFYYGRVCDYCLRKGSKATFHGILPVNIQDVRFEKSQIPWMTVPGKRPAKNHRLDRIFLCLPCRKAHYDAFPEPIPSKIERHPLTVSLKIATQRFMIAKALIPKKRKQTLTEADLLLIAREYYGGDIGIQAERLCRLNSLVKKQHLLPSSDEHQLMVE